MKKSKKISSQKKSIFFVILLCISLISTFVLWNYSTGQNEKNNNNNIISDNSQKNQESINVNEDPYKDYVEKTINDYKISLQNEKREKAEVAARTNITESFEQPITGNIVREYSKNELVYFEEIQEWRVHEGIDITPKSSLIVSSAHDGTISKIVTSGPMGVSITIDHGNDLFTIYSCLSSSAVEVGQKIKKGEKIGTLGVVKNIESSTTPHLHFEIIVKGENCDPTSCYAE